MKDIEQEVLDNVGVAVRLLLNSGMKKVEYELPQFTVLGYWAGTVLRIDVKGLQR